MFGLQQVQRRTPYLVNEELEKYVDEKLDRTAEHFKSNVDTYWDEGDIYVMEFNDDWLTQSLEDGAEPFDMKETHLRSPKAKISKDGYKYMVIPIKPDPNSRGGGTAKSQFWHKLTKQALENPIFAAPQIKYDKSGSVTTMERLITPDRRLQGMYRTKQFKNEEKLKNGEVDAQNFVIFRVMSNRPGNEAKWLHPGIEALDSHEHIETWGNTEYVNHVENIMSLYTDIDD